MCNNVTNARISVFMLSLADPEKYYQVFLAQGPGMGIGAGMMYMPALTVQVHHWRHHRALAMGAVMTGEHRALAL